MLVPGRITEQNRVRLLASDAVIASGVSMSEAARLYGVSASAVAKWVHAARAAAGRVEPVVQQRRGRHPGEVSKLAPWQQAQVVKTSTERNSGQPPFALWTREAVRDLVGRRFAVRLAIRTVGT